MYNLISNEKDLGISSTASPLGGPIVMAWRFIVPHPIFLPKIPKLFYEIWTKNWQPIAPYFMKG